jgi:hypothetical protein
VRAAQTCTSKLGLTYFEVLKQEMMKLKRKMITRLDDIKCTLVVEFDGDNCKFNESAPKKFKGSAVSSLAVCGFGQNLFASNC